MSLRVLHVVPVAPGGGTSGFTQRQIDRLAEAGVEGRVAFFAGAAMVTRLHRLPGAVAAIRQEMKTFQPDVVHAHWGSLLALASALASIGGPPLVISYRGSDINPVPSEARARSVIRVACSQAAALRAAAIICMSDELRGRLWWRRDRARVILDGTDLARFSPRPRDEARVIIGWPLDERVVLFNAGRSPEVKRLDLAEAAVTVARQRLGPLRFEVMRGDVPYDEVPLRLNAADCVLMTSDFEGSPNIVREALACGTPVVSVPVGDVHRWLNGVEGTRIVERVPVAIGEAVAEVIGAGTRPDVGARARAFSEEASRDAVLDVYRRIATGSG